MTVRVRTPLYSAVRAAPLRVVLVGPSRVPRWLACAFELARDRDDVELHALRVEARAAPSPRRLPFGLYPFLWLERTLLRLFLRVRGRSLDGPLSRVPLPATAAAPEAGTDVDALRAQLAALRPGLVLLAGPAEWAPLLAATATHGCWVLDGDTLDPVRAGAALLSPILAGEDATPVTLELQDDGTPTAQVLASSWGATRAVSFSQHRDLAFLKLPALLLRAIRGLPEPAPAAPAAARLRVGPAPARWNMGMCLRAAWIALRLVLQSGARRRATHQPWYVLLPEDGEALRPESPRVGRHRSLVAPGRNYWADPFLVNDGGRCLLFVEEFIDAHNRGVIGCLQLQDDGGALNLGTVLDEPFHLSYPQVFRWRDAWYMTVESYEAERVSLYRADDFPRGWTRVSDLLRGRACVDPTLHHHEGRWYLFANVSESGGNPSDELFLFVADELEGPYRPHPANPLVADVRSARPAGQLFRRDGRLYRPAQCCAPVYGAAVVFNEVLELGPDRYRERVVSRLDPHWSPQLDGCHTFNMAGDRQVLDAHGPPPPRTGQWRVKDALPVRRGSPPMEDVPARQSRMDLLIAASMLPWYL